MILRVRNWERAQPGDSRVPRGVHWSHLEVFSWQLSCSGPAPWRGQAGGWTQLETHRRAWPCCACQSWVAGPLHGSRRSRRPRWELPLSQRMSPELACHHTCESTLVSVHMQSIGQLTRKRRNAKAFPVIFNPTKQPKSELHLGSHNLLTTEYTDFKDPDEEKLTTSY